jgi:2-oxoisovalerate dehydrogenase E1 component
LDSGKFTEADLAEVEDKVNKEISAAHKKGLAAPNPDPASIFDFVSPEPYVGENTLKGFIMNKGNPLS